jgi:DNA repair exonuclease SbcCD ATPase subunit
MITFKKIRYRNFLSTGNQFTEIDFQKHNTNLIIGVNGSGKSTFLDALTFVLFNKSFRKVNKNQLINSTNEKDCLVEIDFSVNNKNYLVRRGIKPSIFDIEIDGNRLNRESDDKANQKLLEENILKLNYKSFTQIVILGSSNFVPFMQLTAANRREVIEDLLDIRIFSTMNGLVKEKIRFEREQIKLLENNKENLKDKIEMQKNFIEEIENRGNENIKLNYSKIKILDQEVSQYLSNNVSLEAESLKLIQQQEEYSNSSNRLSKLLNLKGKISQKVTTITKEYKFFTENSVCPTCTQEIDENFRLNRIETSQNKAKELQTSFKELEDTIKLEQEREGKFLNLSKEITKLNHEISQNNTRISSNQRQIRDFEKEIQKITEQLKNRNIEHEKLENFKQKLQELYDDLLTKKENIKYYEFINSLLKDDGVKTKIIQKYLPFINQQVNRYLRMMDFYINFELDSEFNEKIKSPIHEDFSYSSFSEGERAKINLALIFAWRELARIKNSANCNILLFDEVFDGSLDSFGTDEFLKIIRYVIKDSNIFVISHKADLYDKFGSVIQFEKIKGFSRIISSVESTNSDESSKLAKTFQKGTKTKT